jgi:hypothetical protein
MKSVNTHTHTHTHTYEYRVRCGERLRVCVLWCVVVTWSLSFLVSNCNSSRNLKILLRFDRSHTQQHMRTQLPTKADLALSSVWEWMWGPLWPGRPWCSTPVTVLFVFLTNVSLGGTAWSRNWLTTLGRVSSFEHTSFYGYQISLLNFTPT